MTSSLQAFSTFIAALTCATLAVVIWNVGTRSPARVVVDLLRSLHSPRVLFFGVGRFVAGTLLLLIAGAAIVTILPPGEFDHFAVYFTIIIVCALAVELLVGEELRALLRLKR